jgi:monoterpene epsilon-lactone hydrolase
MSDATTDAVLHLTRDIATPQSVSPQAQAAIKAGSAAVPQRLAEPEAFPSLDDGAAWKARIAVMDEFIGLGFGGPPVEATTEKIHVEGIDVYVITPTGADAGHDAPVLYDIHGGALIAGGGDVCRMMGTSAAARAGLHTWAVDYRMPPDHPYPTPLDDCVAVYRALLEVKPPEKIVVAGGSAGGNLAAALMLRARAEGLPMPKALMLFTPEADLTESGDTFDTNAGVDYVLLQRLTESIALYAGDHDLLDPFLSPLFGDLSEFPPTFLQSGTRDLFLSNTVRMHRALRAVDVDAELHVWEAMPHGGFFGAPEDLEMGVEARKFLAKHL